MKGLHVPLSVLPIAKLLDAERAFTGPRSGLIVDIINVKGNTYYVIVITANEVHGFESFRIRIKGIRTVS